MWLLDTVALSETYKRSPNAGFADWISDVEFEAIHTSALVLGEIRRGVELLPPGEKRSNLGRWLEVDLASRLSGRVHPVDERVGQVWGRFGARGKANVVDALIGATALVHRLTVVTRNARDFDGLGVAVVNPWT